MRLAEVNAILEIFLDVGALQLYKTLLENGLYRFLAAR
jgi:hypothetical protein